MCTERAPSKELFKDPKHPYTKALLSAIPIPNIEMRNKKIEVIKGEVTSPVNPKPGCRFAPRCPNATEACTAQTPEFREISPGHYCACPFAQ